MSREAVASAWVEADAGVVGRSLSLWRASQLESGLLESMLVLLEAVPLGSESA